MRLDGVKDVVDHTEIRRFELSCKLWGWANAS